MKQICKFRKGADIVEVVPNLGVDICNAIETGIIQDTSSSVFHNMMAKTAEVGPVARDKFDVIEYDRAYSKFRRDAEEELKTKE